MRGIQERKKIIKIIILKRPLRNDNTKQIYQSSMLYVTSFYMIHVKYVIEKREKSPTTILKFIFKSSANDFSLLIFDSS